MTVLQLLIAVLFASAAVSKLRNFIAFVTYLQVPFGRFAPVLAAVTVGVELLVAVICVLDPFRRILPWMVFGTILAFSLFYAVRLSLSHDTSCACWGGISHDTERSFYGRALAPMAVGLRNGAISFVAMLFTQGRLQEPVPLIVRVATAVSCEVVVLIGLIASIAKLRADHGSAWRTTYSSRWQHVRGCTRLDSHPNGGPDNEVYMPVTVMDTD